MQPATVVELQSVSKSFDDVTHVLHDVDLQVGPRDAVAVLGPSGSGKSTLLHLLAGLTPPSSGTVRFDGADLASLDADRLAALRNREIGFVFQAHHLMPHCSALENVLVPTLAIGDRARREAAVTRARALLAEVGLGDRATHLPGQLSGGECQRVAVVRALINEPSLLLADEPTGSLDAAAADHLGDLLVELNSRTGVALLIVTHSERIAARMQRRCVLENGVLR
jgi:predicted ABC-type transport system involved in lysophospholipase L1 biosynthesis ATPase subunit